MNERKEKAPASNVEAKKKSFMNIVDPDAAERAATNPGPMDCVRKVEAIAMQINEDGSRSFKTSYGCEYFLTADGVEYETSAMKRAPLCGLLEVAADIADKNGEDARRLVRWLDCEGMRHERIFARSELMNANQLCKFLVDASLRVDAEIKSQGGAAQLISNYLLKAPAGEKRTGVRSLGWYGAPTEGVFVLPGGEVIANGAESEKLTFTGSKEFAPQYEAHGTLKEWQDGVAGPARHSSRAAFAICVGFAAPLMAFVSEESGGFHFYGPSSRGKSTAIRAMCSVWASADSEEMASWRGTDNGFEALFEAHNALPVIMDELGQARNARLMMELAYMIGNNKGKRRMSRTLTQRKVAAWRSLFLSSGELTITEAAEKDREVVPAGVLVRMAHIPAIPHVADDTDANGIFDYVTDEADAPAPDELARKINSTAKVGAYGTAGPAFVRHVVDALGKDHGQAFATELKERIAGWVSRRGPFNDPQIERVAYRFALVAAAGELAIAYGVLPWARGFAAYVSGICFRDWRENFKTPEEEEDELIDHVQNEIDSHRNNFDVYDESGLKLVQCQLTPLYGYLIESKESPKAYKRGYFIPAQFAVLCKGRNKKGTLAALSRQGALLAEKGRHTLKINNKGGGKPDKFVPVYGQRVILVELSKLGA